MLQNNSTTHAPNARAYTDNTALKSGNRQPVTILFCIREAILRRDRINDYIDFLLNEVEGMEECYEDDQRSFDDNQTAETLAPLIDLSSEIVAIGQQLYKAQAELKTTIQNITDLRAELLAAQKGKSNE